jgi:hypothetical protein
VIMNVLLLFSTFASTVLLFHKYRKSIHQIHQQYITHTVENNKIQNMIQPPSSPYNKPPLSPNNKIQQIIQPSSSPKFYPDKISIILKQQSIPSQTKNYELQFFECSLKENNERYCIYLLGCNNSTIGNFLRCSHSSNDIYDENKILSNDYLPNCLFIQSSFTFQGTHTHHCSALLKNFSKLFVRYKSLFTHWRFMLFYCFGEG